MTPAERRIVRNVIRRLKGEGPVSPDLLPHFQRLNLYLTTWVVPALEIIAREGRTRSDMKTAEELSAIPYERKPRP